MNFRNFQIAIFTYLILLLISIDCKQSPSKLSQASHQMTIKFYHQQQIPHEYYWVILEGDYEGDNYTVLTNEMLSEVVMVKDIIDVLNNNLSGRTIILIEDKPNADQFIQQVSLHDNYHLALSSLGIQISQNYHIYQTLYIRLQDDKKLLAKLVDKLQSSLSISEGLKLSAIQKNTKDHYPQKIKTLEQDSQLYQQVEILDEEMLIEKINQKAQKYCKSLQMKLHHVQSYRQLNPLTYDQTFPQQPSEHEEPKQNTYYQIYRENLLQQNFQFENTFFEVNALCTGVKPFKKLNPRNFQSSGFNINLNKITTGSEIQKEIQRMRKILKNKK